MCRQRMLVGDSGRPLYKNSNSNYYILAPNFFKIGLRHPPPPGKQNYPQLILKKIPLDPLQWAILLKGFSYFSGYKRVTDTRSFWYQLTQLGNGRHVASGGGCYFPFLATNIFEFLKFTKLIENIILRSPPSSKKNKKTNHILGKYVKNVCVFVCVLCNILPKSKCITKTLNSNNRCPYCIQILKK